MSKRILAYKAIFTGPQAKIVLADLAKFCRARETTLVVSQGPSGAMVDPHATIHAEGRREVFLRIMTNLNMDLDTMFAMERPNDRD